MRLKFMALAAAASFTLVGFGAEAMPAGTAAAGAASPAPQVTQVAQGCGPGFRLGPGGACRPMGGRAVVVERPVVVERRPAVVVRRPGCGVQVGPIGVRTPC